MTKLEIIDTPIPPCADVETVGYAHSTYLGQPFASWMQPADSKKDVLYNTPLVRRTDMEAQVARVAAEKDAEIVRFRVILTKLDYAAHELEQTEAAQSVHQLAHICLSLLSDHEAIRKSALDEWEALNEGSNA